MNTETILLPEDHSLGAYQITVSGPYSGKWRAAVARSGVSVGRTGWCCARKSAINRAMDLAVKHSTRKT